MKIIPFSTREDWLRARLGKITGTRLGDIVNKGGGTKELIMEELDRANIPYDKKAKKEELQAMLTAEQKASIAAKGEKKLGFYELVAERMSVSEEDFDGYVPNETPMDRGTRLQKHAVDAFTKKTGKKVCEDLVLWTRDDNESIAISPDGTVIDENSAVETKCLSSARHVQAYMTREIPDEYEFQKLQYFIVNPDLQKLYFCFYDPRLPAIQFFFIEVLRTQIQDQIDDYLAYQRIMLNEVDAIVAKLSNF